MSETPAEQIARIELELASLRAARLAAASGKQVEDVWRDGRRVRYTAYTLAEWNAHERYLQGQLYTAQIAAGLNPEPRRRAIDLAWGN